MNKTPAPDSSDLSGPQFQLVCEAHANHGVAILTDGNRKRTARSLYRKGFGDVEKGAGDELIFRLSQSGADELDWLDEVLATEPDASPQAPYLNEGGKITPLMPILYIDTHSDAGSYADALAHSVNIKQSDFNNHSPELTHKP